MKLDKQLAIAHGYLGKHQWTVMRGIKEHYGRMTMGILCCKCGAIGYLEGGNIKELDLNMPSNVMRLSKRRSDVRNFGFIKRWLKFKMEERNKYDRHAEGQGTTHSEDCPI